MNHLAHFFLSSDNPGLLVGGFLGDHIKGLLNGERPDHIEAGIKLHRAIDAYTDQHAITRQSQRRFEPRFRRVSGIMTDIIFDHFLALYWRDFHCQSLQSFSDDIFQQLLAHREQLPPIALKTCERMHAANSLINYSDPHFIDYSLTFIARRLTRQTPINEGYSQFVKHQDQLESDFRLFFPELIHFCQQWKAENNQGHN